MTALPALLRPKFEAFPSRRAALNRWSLSLTAKMFVLVLLAVMPALAIQSYNEYDLRKSREDDIRNKTVQITKQFGAEMGEIREGAHQFLQVMSQLPLVASMDQEGCARMLWALNAKTPYYTVLGVADRTGKVRCTSRPTSLTLMTQLPVFQRALAQTDLAVGNFWVDPESGEKQIHFGLQFADENGGAVAGVVFVGLDLGWLSEHLKERGLTPTQSILIADRVGNIIARLPRGEALVGKNMRNGHAEIMDGDTAGWEESTGVDGVDRIYGYVPPAMSPKDFFLSAGESKAAAFAAIDYVTRRGILLILLGLLLAGYAAWLGGRFFIKRPIQSLLRVTVEWRNGNYAARSQFREQLSEIGRLGAAFNEMAEAVATRHDAQQRAESRLQELNGTLEERVERRTRELVAANRAKSQFLANMSHEIRTPMNGVSGMLQLLRQTELEPKQLHFVDTAQRSADAMLSLITGILDLSRIEAGRFVLEAKKFDLREMMQDVVTMLEPMAKQKGLELSLALPSDIPTALVGDPARLCQVFNNLVGNAIKFTDQGGIAIDAALKEVTADSAVIQFEVRDTGIGISKADQAIIFNAFTQADSSDTRRFSGSGLGLSICKELCALMGGSISVSSEQGGGSSFRFSAQFLRQAEPAGIERISADRHRVSEVDIGHSKPAPRLRPAMRLATGTHPAHSQVLGSAVGTGALEAASFDTTLPDNAGPEQPLPEERYALVVEDNAINLMVAVGVLEHLGWKVKTASNGIEALTALEVCRFDVIFMDCQMPKMDGFEATIEIRRRELQGAARTPIVGLTATADNNFRSRCLSVGMDEFVAKPFTLRQIEVALATVV